VQVKNADHVISNADYAIGVLFLELFLYNRVNETNRKRMGIIEYEADLLLEKKIDVFLYN